MPIDASFRNTGPRRLCPKCKQQRSTYRGRFVTHFGVSGNLICPGSDKPVPKAEEPAQAPEERKN